MFAYCLNNPTNMLDTCGQFAILIGALIEVVGIVVCAIFVVSIVASPQFQQDFSNVLSWLVEKTSALITSAKHSSSASFANSVSKGLEDIASSAKEYTCASTADKMAEYLKKKNQKGYIITIQYKNGRDFIWSDIKNKTISYTGIHVGLEYNGIVYCVVHPYGLPEAQWIDDFKGTGIRKVWKIAIV